MSSQSWRMRIRNALWSIRDNPKAQLWLALGLVVLILTIVVTTILIVRGNSATKKGSEETINIQPSVDTENLGVRFIDGLEVENGKENALPVAVMIENLVSVRPQSGLQSAQVVYEALAEGGITRFVALYADRDMTIDSIGPVRSARPYFVDWAEEYRALYAHVGGSPQALEQLSQNTAVTNLDQFSNAQFFWREASLSAPHNVFTSSELLTFALRDNALADAKGTFEPWKFLLEKAPEVETTAEQATNTIRIPFSSTSYEVIYTYDAIQQHYVRANGGEPHLDALTGEQIHAKNVIVQFTPTRLLGDGTERLDIDTTGTGRAVVFRHGTAIEGTWKKDSSNDRTTWLSHDGEEIRLAPGNIWIAVLPEDRDLEYTQ